MSKTKEFNIMGMDKSARPQDDYFQYANGGWIAKNPVPANESRWGSFTKLRYETEQKLHTILNELLTKKDLRGGTPEQMIRDFYRSGMDMKLRNLKGVMPLDRIRKEIKSVKNLDELLKLVPKLHMLGISVFFGVGVDQDSKQSTRYALHFFQSGLGMPDRDYYFKEDAESERVRTAYKKHVKAVYKLMGRSKNQAEDETHNLFSFEHLLARVSMTKEDKHDAEKVYYKKTLKEFQKLAPSIVWKEYIKAIGGGTPTNCIVMQPKFFTHLSKFLKIVPFEELKSYVEWHVVNDYSSHLSERFIKQSFSFYGTVLSGTKVIKPLWRRIMNTVSGSLGEPLGRIFVAKHFPPKAKEVMNEMVEDLFSAYRARILAVDWMSRATKKKALLKLRAMNQKIGYPDKWRSYKDLVVRADEYVENIMRSSAYEHKRNIKKLGKPIDRGEWYMNPHTVNAYFAPNLNDIVFPAGILQAPFFSTDAEPVLNYGAIGSVIGHEITHGFDDDGSKFDAKGNMKNWWTPTDRKRFMKKAKIIEKQFDQYTVADGVKVNGRLTLGENIADLGGVSIALDAYRLRYGTEEVKDKNGFTTTERFFLGFSLFEREHSRPEVQKLLALTDPHSPAKFRINGTLANVDDFYKTYNVAPKDKLYRARNIRAKIW